MINLLVVDDEPIIVNSLYQMLSESTEWEMIVFMAVSGSQALEIAHKNRIDVMLTDICMPNIDGLELHRLVQAQWPLCRVIYLTGYDSFDYAQKAIRQNGAGYVLKVEGDQAILASLRAVIAEVETARVNQQLIKRVESALPLLHREFIGELLQSHKYTDDELAELMGSIGFPLRADLPVLLLLTFTHPIAGHGEHSSLGGMFGVISIIEEYLQGSLKVISVPQPPDMVLTLYQPTDCCTSPESWKTAQHRVRETLEEIQESSQRIVGLMTSHIIAAESCDWCALANKRNRLEAAAHIYGFDNRSIISDETMELDSVRKKKLEQIETLAPSPHQLAQLRLCLSNSDIPGMDALLAEFQTELSSQEVPYSVAKEIYYSLSLVFLRSINDIGLENIKWKADPELLTNMKAHFTWSMVFEYFKEIGRSIICSRSSEKIAYSHLVVEQINDYIIGHLHEDVGLVSLAEKYHFHPSYLARLYKHVAGITLGQYIVQVKMLEAKKRLSAGDIPINDISKGLGFTAGAYFSKFFKTHTGLTPSDYRRQVLRIENTD